MKTKLTLLMLALVALAASAATQVARRAAADPINAAIEAAKDGVVAVYLDEDLTLTEPITVPLGKQLVIYGRNHTLTLGSGTNFVINDNLTLNNVKIDATELTKPLIALAKEPASGTPKNQDVYARAVGGSLDANDVYLLSNVSINNVMIRELKNSLVSNGSTSWSLENLTIRKSIIQLNVGDGKNFIDMDGSTGAVKDMTITENTIYNLQENNKAYFIRFSNASNAAKIYGLNKSGATQELYWNIANNTFVRTFTSKDFGNNIINNKLVKNVFSQNVFYDVYRLYQFLQNNQTRTTVGNITWYVKTKAADCTNDQSRKDSQNNPYSTLSDPGFKAPTTALDLTQRKGGIDLRVSESSKAAEYESGDPRWLPRDEYLYTLDFASLTDEDYEAIPTSIDGIAINDEVSDAVVTITGSDNKYVKGEAVALEMNGGALEFTAPEGSMIQNIFIDFEEWNEGNTAEGVEPTISVDAEKKQAVISDASPVVKLNIAGKTVIKNIFVELSTRSDKIVIDAPAGASLNKLVDDTYAENPYVGQITMNLEKDGKYTVDGPLFVNCPLYINGAEGVEIDAAASNAPFILMRPLPELGLNANGAYEIKGIVIKDVKITGLKNRLFYANRQDYLIGKLAVENSVIQLDGSTPRSIFDFYCGGNYEELSIVNSTLYADPSNAMRGGLVSTQSSKSIIEMGGESQKLSIKNSTLYNIAYGKTPVLQQRHSQYYLSFELAGNVIVNCGEKGNFVAGLNEGQKSSEVKWVVDSNAFNFDGEDSGANEAYGNALSGVVKFADAAKGDFTQSNVAAGDPRWISGTPTAIETVKTAEETSLENAVIYNLNGQRIDKAQAKSGVFIVNGKKVVIK